MVMTEHMPHMPTVFINAWRKQILPKHIARHRSGHGSILDLPNESESEQLARIRKYGPAWAWMGYSQAQRDFFWAVERGETPPAPPPDE
jgi:hypothetical protein